MMTVFSSPMRNGHLKLELCQVLHKNEVDDNIQDVVPDFRFSILPVMSPGTIDRIDLKVGQNSVSRQRRSSGGNRLSSIDLYIYILFIPFLMAEITRFLFLDISFFGTRVEMHSPKLCHSWGTGKNIVICRVVNTTMTNRWSGPLRSGRSLFSLQWRIP